MSDLSPDAQAAMEKALEQVKVLAINRPCGFDERNVILFRAGMDYQREQDVLENGKLGVDAATYAQTHEFEFSERAQELLAGQPREGDSTDVGSEGVGHNKTPGNVGVGQPREGNEPRRDARRQGRCPEHRWMGRVEGSDDPCPHCAAALPIEGDPKPNTTIELTGDAAARFAAQEDQRSKPVGSALPAEGEARGVLRNLLDAIKPLNLTGRTVDERALDVCFDAAEAWLERVPVERPVEGEAREAAIDAAAKASWESLEDADWELLTENQRSLVRDDWLAGHDAYEKALTAAAVPVEREHEGTPAELERIRCELIESEAQLHYAHAYVGLESRKLRWESQAEEVREVHRAAVVGYVTRICDRLAAARGTSTDQRAGNE